ncbi:MAG: signal peptidase I [Coriobacteriales bacterium]|jgi:signal peptidase I|nr:signal peptidase I [Coriobacteriales bacterium]
MNEPHEHEVIDVQKEERTKRIFREVLEVIVIVAAALIITTVLRIYVIDQYAIPTGSMEPTIEINDRLFAEKVSYRFGDIQPGDIVTFNDPIEPGRVLIKRVIAVGGQTVDLQNGVVLVDGVALDEPYTYGKESVPLDPMVGMAITYPYAVPEGYIWVMGDNRTNSLDSRYFGAISDSTVLGKALIRIWPLDRFGAL